MDIPNILTDHILESMNDYVSIMDNNGNFVKVNSKQIKIMGYRANSHIIGRSYHQFKGLTTDIAENFLAQDRLVISSHRAFRFLSYRRYNDGNWHLLLGDKSCIMNSNAQVEGIFSQSRDITRSKLIDFSRFMFDVSQKFSGKAFQTGFDYCITDESFSGLSKKEMSVLFYFLRGKSAREIAEIMDRSGKTINFHLEKIKCKFNVHSKADLIEKAIFDGFMNYIPEEIISKQA